MFCSLSLAMTYRQHCHSITVYQRVVGRTHSLSDTHAHAHAHYTHTHTLTHKHIYTYAYTCTHTYTQTCTHKRTHTRTHTHTHPPLLNDTLTKQHSTQRHRH